MAETASSAEREPEQASPSHGAAEPEPASLEETLGLSQKRTLSQKCAAALGRCGGAIERVFFGPTGLAGARRRLRERFAWLGEGARAPALMLAGAALGAGVAALPPVQAALNEGIERMRAEALTRPEFAINRLEVVGAQRLSDADLRAAIAPPEAPRAALAFDFQAARERLEALGWVERASIILRPPHTLAVEIVERSPAALWRREDRLSVIDAGGVIAAAASSRREFPELPLVVGLGAEQAAPEALRLYAAARAGGLAVAALTRIGERRWDLELVGGPRVMLPEDDPEAALERAVSWAHSADLLERGFEVVDLRLPFAPTARGGEAAPALQAAPASFRVGPSADAPAAPL